MSGLVAATPRSRRQDGTNEHAASPYRPLTLTPLLGIPAIHPGDDLAGAILGALRESRIALLDGDVLVVSSKVVSKAQGLVVSGQDKSEVVRSQSGRVVTERRTSEGWVTRVVESVAGPVMAAAGVDASNSGGVGALLLLPRDPDAAARELLEAIRIRAGRADLQVGVVISDTAGRPWRMGQVDFALGAAGLALVEDHRGRLDVDGRTLSVTLRALGDEIASAADLVKGKDRNVPVAHVRGLDLVGAGTIERARDLVRSGPEDWFAYGVAESVRAALGVEPDTPDAQSVGLPALLDEPAGERLGRALRLALHLSTQVRLDARADTAEPAVVRLSCADPVELGRALGRLDAALWAERLRRTGEDIGQDADSSWQATLTISDVDRQEPR